MLYHELIQLINTKNTARFVIESLAYSLLLILSTCGRCRHDSLYDPLSSCYYLLHCLPRGRCGHDSLYDHLAVAQGEKLNHVGYYHTPNRVSDRDIRAEPLKDKY